MSFYNRKKINISKSAHNSFPKNKHFTCIDNDYMFQAMNVLSGTAFKLYCYFSSNKKGFVFLFNVGECCEKVGISRSQCSQAFKELEEKGYIKYNSTADVYDFNPQNKYIKNE